MGGSTPAAPGRIFISYRRQETAYPAGWLYERVAAHFGREQVFKDVDSIKLGDDFPEVIANAVGSCDVLLALIGDRWLTITDEDGRRRLDDPDDFVRLEIESALERNIRVIPVLFEGARLPRSGDLPASLSKLVRRQALELSPSRFDADIGKLLRVLESTLAEEQARREAAAKAAREAEEQTRREAEARAAREAEEQARRGVEERKLSAIEKMVSYLRSDDPPAIASAEGALRRLANDANQRVAQTATHVLIDWEAAKKAQREADDQQARRKEQAAREAEEQARREAAAKAAREAEEQTRREAEARAAREAEEQARREVEERKLSAIETVAQELRSGSPSTVASAEGALRRLANDANQRVAQTATHVLANWQAEAKVQREAEAKAQEAPAGLRKESQEKKIATAKSGLRTSPLGNTGLGRSAGMKGYQATPKASSKPNARVLAVLGVLGMVVVLVTIFVANRSPSTSSTTTITTATTTATATATTAEGAIIDIGPESEIVKMESPWLVQVTGPYCWVAVKDATDGSVVREGLSEGYILHVRQSGEFFLQGDIEGHDGCEATIRKGTGGKKSLPLTVPSGEEDSPVFRSPGRLHITANPDEDLICLVTLYRSKDGSELGYRTGDKSESWTWDLRVSGDVWLNGAEDCNIRVTGSSA
jgi:hypothetical protein